VNENSTDLYDTLVRLRPSTEVLDAEWPAAHRDQVRQTVTDSRATRALHIRFSSGPVRRRAIVTVGIASAAAAVVVGIVLPVGSPGGPTAAVAAPIKHLQRAAVQSSVATIRTGQFAYRVEEAYTTRGRGKPVLGAKNAEWVDEHGATWSRHREGAVASCARTTRHGALSMTNPTREFLASLPTDPRPLREYLRSHVSGSSSKDEAVFVIVGDALRDFDGLATPELRAGLLGVLGLTGHVEVHAGARTLLGQPATRVDFVDAQHRPGEIDSLFFDPKTAQLVEERHTGKGQGGVVITNSLVTRSEKVTNRVPTSLAACPDLGE
jgi:hypothetical protein